MTAQSTMSTTAMLTMATVFNVDDDDDSNVGVDIHDDGAYDVMLKLMTMCCGWMTAPLMITEADDLYYDGDYEAGGQCCKMQTRSTKILFLR